MFICGPLLDSLLLPEESCQVELEFIVIADARVLSGVGFLVRLPLMFWREKSTPLFFLKMWGLGFRVVSSHRWVFSVSVGIGGCCCRCCDCESVMCLVSLTSLQRTFFELVDKALELQL